MGSFKNNNQGVPLQKGNGARLSLQSLPSLRFVKGFSFDPSRSTPLNL
jgi:hypothetical protein